MMQGQLYPMKKLCLCNSHMISIHWASIEWPHLCITHSWDPMGFPGGSDSKASAHNAGDPGSIPGLGRSSGEGNGKPLQYSCLENSMDEGACWATVHGVAKSWTRLSDFTFTFTLERDFPGGSADKESTCNAGDTSLILGSGRSPGGGHGNTL